MYLAVCPSELYFVHSPQLVDVLSQLVPHIVEMWRQDDLDHKDTTITTIYNNVWERFAGLDDRSWRRKSHLTSVNRNRNEGSLREELCGAQKISHSFQISLILFDRLDAHLFFREQGFVTRCVSCWRQELEVSVATTQQEANP